VIVHIPKYHGFAELLVTDERGNEIGVAVADRAFDDRGAQESSRRVSIRNKALTTLAKSVPDINVGAELIAYDQKQVPVVPNEPGAIISVARPGPRQRALPLVEIERRSRPEQDEELRRKNAETSAIFAQMNEGRRGGS